MTIAFLMGAQAMDIVLPAWLSLWNQAYTSKRPEVRSGFYLGMFAGKVPLYFHFCYIFLISVSRFGNGASHNFGNIPATLVCGSLESESRRTPEITCYSVRCIVHVDH